MRKLFFRHNLIWVLLLVMILPGILAIIVSLLGPKAIFKWMLPQYRLAGVTQEIKTSPLDFTHIKSHEFQSYSEKWLGDHLPLRSLFIRLNNQFFYSFFKKSYTDNGEMIIGKHNQLFELAYIKSYCGMSDERWKDPHLIEWADKLKILSDFFTKQGKTFVYVITPSKAEYMPEVIPDRFHCKNIGISPHIHRIAALLAERNVRYVNGAELMVKATQDYGFSMFPQGGIHWNKVGATVSANAIIDAINQTGFALPPLEFTYEMSNIARGQDRDLLWLMNLISPDSRYPSPTVNFKNANLTDNHISAAFIGGSFLEKIVHLFSENNTFSKMSYYRYFKLDKTDFAFGKPTVKHNVDPDSSDILSTILNSNIVILEENSVGTIMGHALLFFDVMNKFALNKETKHLALSGKN